MSAQSRTIAMTEFESIAVLLASIGHAFYQRGWVLGTSGNFSAVVGREPLLLAMSQSGVDKGDLTADQILLIDDRATIVGDQPGKPSDECLLHLQIARQREAGAVLHTHSIWSTLLSDVHAADGGITLEGYEMLKGLEGIKSHEHREWLPIIENSQDMRALAGTVAETLHRWPEAHAFLLRRHGLYTWGKDIVEARRHVEILEFLLETYGRMKQMPGLFESQSYGSS